MLCRRRKCQKSTYSTDSNGSKFEAPTKRLQHVCHRCARLKLSPRSRVLAGCQCGVVKEKRVASFGFCQSIFDGCRQTYEYRVRTVMGVDGVEKYRVRHDLSSQIFARSTSTHPSLFVEGHTKIPAITIDTWYVLLSKIGKKSEPSLAANLCRRSLLFTI